MTLFISAFMTSGYVGSFMTPGQVAILSLDDKYFYLALAMIVTALVAASQWDVLAIDPRDAAILEPLAGAGGHDPARQGVGRGDHGRGRRGGRQWVPELGLPVDDVVQLSADAAPGSCSR